MCTRGRVPPIHVSLIVSALPCRFSLSFVILPTHRTDKTAAAVGATTLLAGPSIITPVSSFVSVQPCACACSGSHCRAGKRPTTATGAEVAATGVEAVDTAPSGVETNTETAHICNPSVPGTEINIDHSPHVIVLSQQESSSTAAVSLILSTSLKDCKHTGHLQESPRILVEIIALDEDEECSPLPGESFMVEVAESWRCDEAGSTVNFEDAEHYEGGIPAVSDARSKEHAPAIDCDSEAGSTTMTHNQVIDGSSGDAVDQAMEMLRGNLRDRDNEIKRLQSLVKAVQESHDDDKADKLEDLRLKIQQVQSQPQKNDIRLQNIAHLVLQLNEQPNGVTSVTSKTGTIRAYTEYLKLPKHRSCGHTSTRQSQRDYVLRKARLVAEYIELIVDENSRAGVVEKMAELRDFVVLKKRPNAALHPGLCGTS